MGEKVREIGCVRNRLRVKESEQGAAYGKETRKKGEKDGEWKGRQLRHSKKKEQRPK